MKAKQSLASCEFQMFAVFNMIPLLPAALGFEVSAVSVPKRKNISVISALVYPHLLRKEL